MVPHDMNELVKMIGREEFNRRLNEGFEISSEYSFSPPGDRFSAAYVNHGNQRVCRRLFCLIILESLVNAVLGTRNDE